MSWQAILRIASEHCNRFAPGLPKPTDEELEKVVNWIETASADIKLESAILIERVVGGREERAADIATIVVGIVAWFLVILDGSTEKLSPYGLAALGVAVVALVLAVWIYDRHAKSVEDALEQLDGIDSARQKVSELKQRLIAFL